jgi:hypothetical protein
MIVRSIAVALALSLLLACGADTSSGPRSGSGAASGAGAGVSVGGAGGFENRNPTAGTSGTSGTGDFGGSPNDDGVCEEIVAHAEPQTPDMMIVLDRSGSMEEGGRWDPSVAAVRLVTEELQSQVRFGLAMFPQPQPDVGMMLGSIAECVFAPDPNACIAELEAQACAPGSIETPVAIDNAAAIGAALNATEPLGGTPTGGTLEMLLEAFANQVQGPDAMITPKYILLVTDGQPTCPSGAGRDVNQADIDLSYAAMDALTARGVRTYVIGYDTTGMGNEELATVLDGLAQRGNTGDTQHHPVEDQDSLLQTIRDIAFKAVSCSYMLDQPPLQPEFVLVTLDGQQVNLGDPNGWELIGDRIVQLNGTSCATLQGGGSHSVEVQVLCSVVPPV